MQQDKYPGAADEETKVTSSSSISQMATLKVPSTQQQQQPVKEKVSVCVRVKPLGKGYSDGESITGTFSSKRFKSASSQKNQIVLTDIGDASKTAVLKFPTFVCTDQFNQQKVYQKTMQTYTQRFLDGYNVNFMAYGQTGSGKTYTMLGPSQNFKHCPSLSSSDPPPELWGLFPRTCLYIMQALKRDGLLKSDQVNLTLKVSQAGWKEPLCLIKKQSIRLDPVTDDFVCGFQQPIREVKDLIMICKKVEEERASRQTKMNQHSSRTHCIIQLTMYRKFEKKIRETKFKFVDLAGSERIAKTGNTKFDGQQMNQMMFTNYALISFSRIIRHMVSMKKIITGGEEIPPGSCWKQMCLTRVLKSTFNGMAFTVFVYCVSQAQANGGETWCTLDFAKECHKLTTRVVKTKGVSIESLLKRHLTEKAENEAALSRQRASDRQDSTVEHFRKMLLEKNQFMIDMLVQMGGKIPVKKKT